MSLYSVVVPVYNSEHTLQELYTRLEKVFREVIKEEFELILVDADGINIHKLKGLQIYRQVFMFWMKDRYRLPAVERFINYMKEQQAEDANDTENVSKVYLKDIVNF